MYLQQKLNCGRQVYGHPRSNFSRLALALKEHLHVSRCNRQFDESPSQKLPSLSWTFSSKR